MSPILGLKVLPMYELVSLKWMVLHPLHFFCLRGSAAGYLDNCHNLNFGKLQKPIQREASSPSSHTSKYQEQDFLNSLHIYVQSWVKWKCQRKVADSLFCSISAIVQTSTSPASLEPSGRVVSGSVVMSALSASILLFNLWYKLVGDKLSCIF